MNTLRRKYKYNALRKRNTMGRNANAMSPRANSQIIRKSILIQQRFLMNTQLKASLPYAINGMNIPKVKRIIQF